MMLTQLERAQAEAIATRVAELRAFLQGNDLGDAGDPASWYNFLSTIKLIQGNLSNDISFIATLLAKAYLVRRFHLADLDAAEKAQGAPGLDIDVCTRDGHRIVGEIKTTVPYGARDFGAQQKKMFEKDFAKLTSATADHKFMFVTEDETFEILCRPRYSEKIRGVRIVQLLSEREHAA